MREFKIKNHNVKIREYIPFTEMGNINLYGLYYTQTKQAEILKKYIEKLPRKEGEEDQKYEARLQAKMSKKDQEHLQKIQYDMIPLMQPLLSKLLIEPQLKDFTMGEGLRFFKHKETTEVLAVIMEDLNGMRGDAPPDTSKKV